MAETSLHMLKQDLHPMSCMETRALLWPIRIIRISSAFPISQVVYIVGQFDFGYPFYPLVSIFALGHKLKRKAPFRRKNYSIHFVRNQDVIVDYVI